MADLVVGTITKIYGGERTETAGAAFTAGEGMARHAVDGLWYPAKNDTAADCNAYGIALNSGAQNGAITIQTSGQIDLGVAGTVGGAYFVSANSGGLCPEADLTAGKFVTFMLIYLGAQNGHSNAYALQPLRTGIAHG